MGKGVAFALLQAAAVGAYVAASATALSALYGSAYGTALAGGATYLVNTVVPQLALPCALLCAPGALALAAGSSRPALGRAAWALDALLAVALAAAGVAYGAPEALAGTALLAACALVGAREWPAEAHVTREGGDEQ